METALASHSSFQHRRLIPVSDEVRRDDFTSDVRELQHPDYTAIPATVLPPSCVGKILSGPRPRCEWARRDSNPHVPKGQGLLRPQRLPFRHSPGGVMRSLPDVEHHLQSAILRRVRPGASRRPADRRGQYSSMPALDAMGSALGPVDAGATSDRNDRSVAAAASPGRVGLHMGVRVR